MDLKLAESTYEGISICGQTHFFRRFLPCDLDSGFGFYGDKIVISSNVINKEDGRSPVNYIYKKDEKDPLNRFDGLFDGRTYGEGRFVLIINSDDSVFKITNNKDTKEFFITPLRFDIYSYSYQNGYDGDVEWTQHYIGNLHENPELYKKIK